MPTLRPSRLRRAAVLAALACAPLAPLHAQERASASSSSTASASAAVPARLGPIPGTLEIGVSAGVAHTSRWYDAGGEAGTVESGTAFSAEVRYWPVPWAGLRLQAGRFGGRIRTDYVPPGGGTDTPPQELRATVFDASIVVRPLAAARLPRPLGTAYAFAGTGSVELETSGRSDSLVVCGNYTCTVTLAPEATVRQLTLGAGTDLLHLAGFTLFAEASLHRYQPRFGNEYRIYPQLGVRDDPGTGAPIRPALGTSNDPAAVSRVVTRRLAAGVRRTFGARPATPVPPPPPPPAATLPPLPPSPTRGGIVTVATAEPGAEVYLVPRSALEDDPRLRCRLRPVLDPGSFFKGRTTGAQPLRVPAGPRAWVLVVRQQVDSGGRRIWHVHEQRVQLAGGRTIPVQLNMLRDGSPPAACPR